MFKVTFKTGVDPRDMASFTPTCWALFSGVVDYCWNKDLPLTVTSLIKDRDKVNNRSRTHEEGRGFDIRSYHYTKDEREEMKRYFDRMYKKHAAVSSKTGKSTCCVIEEDHLHFQTKN